MISRSYASQLQTGRVSRSQVVIRASGAPSPLSAKSRKGSSYAKGGEAANPTTFSSPAIQSRIAKFADANIPDPILRAALKEPVAFWGGIFAGALGLSLDQDPLKSVLDKAAGPGAFARAYSRSPCSMECESASSRKSVVKPSLSSVPSSKKHSDCQYLYVGSGAGKCSTPAGGPCESAYQPSTSKYKVDAYEEPSPVDTDFLTRIFTGMLEDPTAHWDSDVLDINRAGYQPSLPTHSSSCSVLKSFPLCAGPDSDGEEPSSMLDRERSLLPGSSFEPLEMPHPVPERIEHPESSSEPVDTLHPAPQWIAEQAALVQSTSEQRSLATAASAAAVGNPVRPLSLRQKLGGTSRRVDSHITLHVPKPAATMGGWKAEGGEPRQESSTPEDSTLPSIDAGGGEGGHGCGGNADSGYESHDVADKVAQGQLEFSVSGSPLVLEPPPKLYRCESNSSGGWAGMSSCVEVSEFTSLTFQDSMGSELLGPSNKDSVLEGETSKGDTCLAARDSSAAATTATGAASSAEAEGCKGSCAATAASVGTHTQQRVVGHSDSPDTNSGAAHKPHPLVPKLGLSSIQHSSGKDSREGKEVGGSSSGGGSNGVKGKTELSPQNFVFAPLLFSPRINAVTGSPTRDHMGRPYSSRQAGSAELETTPRRGSSHRGSVGLPSELIRSAGNLERIVSGRRNKNGTPGLIVRDPPKGVPGHSSSAGDHTPKRHSMLVRQSLDNGGSIWASSSPGQRSRASQVGEAMTPPPSSQQPSNSPSAMYSSQTSGSGIMLYGRVGAEMSAYEDLDGGERTSPSAHLIAAQRSSPGDPSPGCADLLKRQQGPHPPHHGPGSARRAHSRYSNLQADRLNVECSTQQEHAAEALHRPPKLSMMELALSESAQVPIKAPNPHYPGKKFSKGGPNPSPSPNPQKTESPPGEGSAPRFASMSARQSVQHSSRAVASARNSSRAYAVMARSGSVTTRDLVDEAMRSTMNTLATAQQSSPSGGRVYRSTAVEATMDEETHEQKSA
eukprot:gene8259-1528_t